MRILIFGCVLALVAGCGAQAPDTIARRPSVTVAEAVPPGMVADSPAPPGPLPPQCVDGAGFDARAISLRPPATMPEPAQMPANSTMDRIFKRGLLVAGVDQNLNLFSSRDPLTGELRGYDVDFVREIAQALFGDRSRVRFRAVNFTNNFTLLKDGEIDILVHSLTITCERRYGRGIAFSTDYLDAGQKVLVRKRSPYNGPADLGGRKVCAPAGTTSIRSVRDYRKAKLVPVAVAEFSDCLVLLQQGQVDAISTTDTVLLGMRQQDPTLEIVGEAMTDEPHGLALRDNESETDMVRFVNGVLEQTRQNGRWRQIYTDWLADLDPGRVIPNPPAARYID
ncbi:MAG: glutamate ABC transporter substrate-binding protein [Kibdelosporangium sp.]